jgi:hypothetical protein
LEQDQHIDAVLVGPGHPLYAAVDEKLNQSLAHALGATAVFVDPQSAAPYRLHFFEISVKGKDSRGADVPLYAEVVAVREDAGLLRAYATMLRHDLHDLPVIDQDGRLCGIASRVDIGTTILTSWQKG